MSAKTEQDGMADERLRSDSAEDVAQWLYANGHHDAAATVRNQIDVRNMRIRELQAAIAQNAQGEAAAYWAAVGPDGVEASWPADDGNGGEVARRECSDWINDRLLNDKITLRLVPLYTNAERARVPAGLRERIERAWHNHDEEGRVHISMGDARLLVEQVLAAAPSQPDATGATP